MGGKVAFAEDFGREGCSGWREGFNESLSLWIHHLSERRRGR